MHALKRQSGAIVRQGAKNDLKVSCVWNPAAIDFDHRNRGKQANAVCFLSRVKGKLLFVEVEKQQRMERQSIRL